MPGPRLEMLAGYNQLHVKESVVETCQPLYVLSRSKCITVSSGLAKSCAVCDATVAGTFDKRATIS